MRHNNITFAYWGGDNTGGGRETFYLDRAQFLQAFPSATSFEFDLRCFWNAVSGGDVITNIDAYQGGSMVLNTNTRVWENPQQTMIFQHLNLHQKKLLYKHPT